MPPARRPATPHGLPGVPPNIQGHMQPMPPPVSPTGMRPPNMLSDIPVDTLLGAALQSHHREQDQLQHLRQHEMLNMQKEIDIQRNNVAFREERLKQQDGELKATRDHVTQLQKAEKEFEKKLADEKLRADNADQRSVTAEGQALESERQRVELTGTVEALRHESETQQGYAERLKSELMESKGMVQTLQQRADNLESDLSGSKEEMKLQLQRGDQLESELTESKDQLEQLRCTLKEVEDEKEVGQARIDELEASIATCQQEVADLKASETSLTQELSSAKMTTAKTRDELSAGKRKYEEELADLQLAGEYLRHQLDGFKTEKDRLEAALEDEKRSSNSLQTDLTRFENESNSIRHSLKTETEAKKKLQEQIAKLTEKLASEQQTSLKRLTKHDTLNDRHEQLKEKHNEALHRQEDLQRTLSETKLRVFWFKLCTRLSTRRRAKDAETAKLHQVNIAELEEQLQKSTALQNAIRQMGPCILPFFKATSALVSHPASGGNTGTEVLQKATNLQREADRNGPHVLAFFDAVHDIVTSGAPGGNAAMIVSLESSHDQSVMSSTTMTQSHLELVRENERLRTSEEKLRVQWEKEKEALKKEKEALHRAEEKRKQEQASALKFFNENKDLKAENIKLKEDIVQLGCQPGRADAGKVNIAAGSLLSGQVAPPHGQRQPTPPLSDTSSSPSDEAAMTVAVLQRNVATPVNTEPSLASPAKQPASAVVPTGPRSYDRRDTPRDLPGHKRAAEAASGDCLQSPQKRQCTDFPVSSPNKWPVSHKRRHDTQPPRRRDSAQQ